MTTYRVDLTEGEFDALIRVISFCSGTLEVFEERGEGNIASQRADELYLVGRDLLDRVAYIPDGQS